MTHTLAEACADVGWPADANMLSLMLPCTVHALLAWVSVGWSGGTNSTVHPHLSSAFPHVFHLGLRILVPND